MDEMPVLEQTSDFITTLTLNRPIQHNALNPQLIRSLTERFQKLSAEDSVRAIILTGSGRSFCAGADIGTMKEAAHLTYEENLAGAEAIFDLMDTVNSCPHPVIGRVNGSAIGGGVGLVSCCDIVVAVDRANFGFTETRLGLVPAVVSPFVMAKIGQSRARELLLTGEIFSADIAKEIGLVHHVVSETQLDDKIGERVAELLQAAPGAARAAKRLTKTIAGVSNNELRSFTSALLAERRASDEGMEGLDAFLKKRPPNWRSQ